MAIQAAELLRTGRARRGEAEANSAIPEGHTSGVVLRRDQLYRRTLALADLSSAAFAICFAALVIGPNRIQPAVLIALPGVVLIAKIIGLYDRDEHLLRKTTLDEAPALFEVATLATLLLWLGGPLFVSGTLTRFQVLGLWLLLFLSTTLSRTILRRFARSIAPTERCLVIGDPVSAQRLRRKFDQSFSLNALIVGRVPLTAEDHAHGSDLLGPLDMLGLVLVEHDIHRVVIAPGDASSDEMLDAIRVAKSLGVKVSVLPRMFEVVGSSARFDDVDGLTLLAVPRYGLTKSSAYLKRLMDLIGAGLALLVFAPLMAGIAVAIKVSSPGPVFFRQKRIGRNGVEFDILKFRSMIDRADEQKAELTHLNEAEGLFKIADDPRITRVGRAIRKTSLDELPQLLNVMRGEMSLVGPRPLVAADDCQVAGYHRRRLQLPPGITGQWQVLGSARIPLQEMVKIDYLYCGNWSLWGDVKILLRTVPFMLGGRGL
jgi:exopolysaccharide biosynthesis polyprenyl glycosylphosphotransferase